MRLLPSNTAARTLQCVPSSASLPAQHPPSLPPKRKNKVWVIVSKIRNNRQVWRGRRQWIGGNKSRRGVRVAGSTMQRRSQRVSVLMPSTYEPPLPTRLHHRSPIAAARRRNRPGLAGLAMVELAVNNTVRGGFLCSACLSVRFRKCHWLRLNEESNVSRTGEKITIPEVEAFLEATGHCNLVLVWYSKLLSS